MPATAASLLRRFHHTPRTKIGKKALAANEKAAAVAVNIASGVRRAATPAKPVTATIQSRATRS